MSPVAYEANSQAADLDRWQSRSSYRWFANSGKVSVSTTARSADTSVVVPIEFDRSVDTFAGRHRRHRVVPKSSARSAGLTFPLAANVHPGVASTWGRRGIRAFNTCLARSGASCRHRASGWHRSCGHHHADHHPIDTSSATVRPTGTYDYLCYAAPATNRFDRPSRTYCGRRLTLQDASSTLTSTASTDQVGRLVRTGHGSRSRRPAVPPAVRRRCCWTADVAPVAQ